MKLTLERIVSDGESTIGLLFLDGRFICFTLEDEYRDKKVYGDTRIPAGLYSMGLRTIGRLHKKYSKFPDHIGMLWIKNIPNFTLVYLHIGNDQEDTLGCPLVGEIANAQPGDMRLMNSTIAYRKLYSLVAPAAESGDLSLEIIDRDR